MEQYLVNISETHVGIPALKIEVPKGGWTDIDSTTASHPDILEAVRRKWVKLSNTKPEGEGPQAPSYNITRPDVLGTTEYPKVAAKKAAKGKK